VKRYDRIDGEMTESDNGRWVLFEEVDSTLTKILKIIQNGTPNRSRYKLWEEKIIDIIRSIIK
jgi:hypothetical protein